MSLTCGIPPAMDVSGMPTFRGGGGSEPREKGWYAVLVCIFRFEDIRGICEDEKDLNTCWHGRREDVVGEANRNIDDDDVKGARSRCVDMMRNL